MNLLLYYGNYNTVSVNLNRNHAHIGGERAMNGIAGLYNGSANGRGSSIFLAYANHSSEVPYCQMSSRANQQFAFDRSLDVAMVTGSLTALVV